MSRRSLVLGCASFGSLEKDLGSSLVHQSPRNSSDGRAVAAVGAGILAVCGDRRRRRRSRGGGRGRGGRCCRRGGRGRRGCGRGTCNGRLRRPVGPCQRQQEGQTKQRHGSRAISTHLITSWLKKPQSVEVLLAEAFSPARFHVL